MPSLLSALIHREILVTLLGILREPLRSPLSEFSQVPSSQRISRLLGRLDAGPRDLARLRPVLARLGSGAGSERRDMPQVRSLKMRCGRKSCDAAAMSGCIVKLSECGRLWV